MTPQHIIYNAALTTPPPRHMKVKKDTQKAGIEDMEKFAAACQRAGVSVTTAIVKMLQRLEADELELSDKEKLESLIKLLPFEQPKLSSSEVKGDPENPVIPHTIKVKIVD